jgi:ribosome-binding protein aMBF1 (putative translation factor)
MNTAPWACTICGIQNDPAVPVESVIGPVCQTCWRRGQPESAAYWRDALAVEQTAQRASRRKGYRTEAMPV